MVIPSINKFKIANQKILEDYLDGDLKDGVEFTMSIFSTNFESQVECGTAGCAVGHAPFAGIEKLEQETWYQFGKRTLFTEPSEYLWLFGSFWGGTSFGGPKDVVERMKVLREYRKSKGTFWEACQSVGLRAVEQGLTYKRTIE